MRFGLDEDTRQVSHGKTRRRCVTGVLMGGILGISFYYGVSGFWGWFYLWGIPLRDVFRTPSSLVDPSLGFLAICGLTGLGWGFLVSRPTRWWVGVLLSTGGLMALQRIYIIGDYFCTCLESTILSDCIRGLSGVDPWRFVYGEEIRLLGCGLLAGLLRGFQALLPRVVRPPRVVSFAIQAIAALVVIALGLTLTWYPAGVYALYLDSDTRALRVVHRHARSQGWEGYSLELTEDVLHLEYGVITVVRVHLSDGTTRTFCVDDPFGSMMDEQPTIRSPSDCPFE